MLAKRVQKTDEPINFAKKPSPNYVNFDWRKVLKNAIRVFYVDASASPAGNGSIATPWQDFSEITEGNLAAGDVILVAGGQYNDQIIWDNVDGTADNPIYIMANPYAATPSNPVLLTGWNDGRNVLLPDNFDSNVASTDLYTVDVSGRPIQLTNCSYLHIAGTTWDENLNTNFVVRGWNAEVLINNNCDRCNLYYLQIHNIGTATYDGVNSWWTTDLPGLSIGSDNSTIAFCNIYNNGQDAIQQRFNSNVENLLIYGCWLHTRQHGGGSGTHPDLAAGLTFSDVSFNWNRHTDGFQIYTNQDGTSTYQDMQFGPTIDSCILGPGLTNGLQIGADIADVSNSKIRNNLFLMCHDNAISFHESSDPKSTIIENNTFVGHTRDQGAGFVSILDPSSDGGKHRVFNNIFATYGTTNFGVKVEDNTGTSHFINNFKYPTANVIDEQEFVSVELNPSLHHEPTGNFDISQAKGAENWFRPTADMNGAGSNLGNIYSLYLLSQEHYERDTQTIDDFAALVEKSTPTTSDWLTIGDAADRNAIKKIQIGNLPSSGGGGDPYTYYIMESDVTISQNTTDTTLTDGTTSMSHAVTSGKTYEVYVLIFVSSGSSTTDWRWRFDSPSGTTGRYGGSNIEDARVHATGWDNTGTQFMSQAGNDDYMEFKGVAFVTTAGNIAFQIRNDADTTSQTISKGAFMRVREIAN